MMWFCRFLTALVNPKRLLVFLLLFFCFFISQLNCNLLENKVRICMSCHGSDGNSINPIWPKIAGQLKTYLVKQLFEYKLGQDGNRYNAIMYGMVKNLSNKDIDDISEYYSNNTTLKSEKKDNIDYNYENGKNIYYGGKSNIVSCGACHGLSGEGNDIAGVPKISGQHSAYIIQQLNNYKTGVRKSFEIMSDISLSMTESDIKDVSYYIEFELF